MLLLYHTILSVGDEFKTLNTVLPSLFSVCGLDVR